ncbi:MAG: DVU0150 family protein [Thermodesulfovibrio sp.]
MKRILISLLSAISLIYFLPSIAMAKEKTPPLVVVAHTKGLSGLSLWWANLYNDNMLLFTILTGCITPIAGILIGFIADYLLSLTGIDLTKRELAEH